MLNNSLASIKQELSHQSSAELIELLTRLAKYKKENKELLNYLLFEVSNEKLFIEETKKEIHQLFLEVNTTNLYWAKKSIRKILRLVNKYGKYSGLAKTNLELLIYFCSEMKVHISAFKSSQALVSLYQAQLNKIDKLLLSLHEDLQYDYKAAISAITEE